MKKLLLSGLTMFLVTLSLTSCKNPYIRFKYNDKNYLHADKVTFGIDEFKNIDIDWPIGNVKIIKTEGTLVTIYNTNKDKTTFDEDYQLRYKVSSGTLNIKFAKNNVLLDKDKDLTIETPIDFYKTIVNTVSANLLVKDINSLELDINAVSGNVELSNVNSGYLDKQSGSKLDINMVSGMIETENVIFDVIDVDTVSGIVNLGVINSISLIDVDTVSGNVSLNLLPELSIKLKFNSVSGKFEGNIKLSDDSTNRVNVNTVSGNLKINKD